MAWVNWAVGFNLCRGTIRQSDVPTFSSSASFGQACRGPILAAPFLARARDEIEIPEMQSTNIGAAYPIAEVL